MIRVRACRFVVVQAAVIGALLSLAVSMAGASTNQADSLDATEIELDSYELSTPVRDLEDSGSEDFGPAALSRINPLASEPDGAVSATRNRDTVPPDPLAASSSAGSSARTPAPGLVFDGTSNPFACGTCSPPDTVGDVGPNHYIQMVNTTKVAIYNKSGSLLAPAFNLGTLFSGPCAGNRGDPVVLYDPIADRWLLSQFQGNPGGPPDHLCFAISQTADPLGSYHLYDFITPEFPDYFKVGVWPNGYYVSTNESTYAAYAFDRAKMLVGDASAGSVRFAGQDNFLLPADVDGVRTPGATEGGLFYTFKDDAFHGGSDRLELFQLNPNFASPASSTFALIATLPIAPYTYTVCGFFDLDCIPQAGTSQLVDPVSEWPMHRFPYRQFGDHQALVGNFTIGGGSAVADGPPPALDPPGPGAAIRWFELRNTGAGWSLFQEGTHDPGGGLNRFMGSIAVDVQGNIGLGYSASSSAEFPSIRYATRAPGDPPGTLGAEQILRAGGGSQTGSPRWGDYSAMSVDPADDCTFWYTNEYYNPSGTTSWKTAIGNFKEATCADTDHDGVADSQDQCPTTFSLEPNGCPSNAFTIGKKKLNKKKGTATVQVTVPGAGKLTLTGKGLERQRPLRAAHGRAAKPVSAAGTVKLKIKPKGKKKEKVKKKGKVKVKPKITYTPTGGLANTQTTKLRLKKKRKR